MSGFITNTNLLGKLWSNFSKRTGGSPPFTPLNLASLFAWLRADLVVLDGSNNVATLTDRSPNGYNATQPSVANRPGYVANAGLGYLNLTGTQSIIGFGTPSNPQPFEVFMVVRSAGTPGGNVYLFDSGFGGNTVISQQNSTGFATMSAGSGITDANLGVVDHIIDAKFNGASSNISLDGGAGTTGNAGTNALGVSFTIGNDGTYTAGFVGRVYEIIICDALLSAPDRTSLISYLKTRYSIV